MAFKFFECRSGQACSATIEQSNFLGSVNPINNIEEFITEHGLKGEHRINNLVLKENKDKLIPISIACFVSIFQPIATYQKLLSFLDFTKPIVECGIVRSRIIL